MCPRKPVQMLVIASTLLVAAGVAHAGHRSHDRFRSESHDRSPYIAYARVIDVQPLIEQVHIQVPVRECYETMAYAPPGVGTPRPRNGVGGTIAGGVVGGVIGDRFGRGEGRDAMRLLGVLVGAAIGHDAATRQQAAYYPQRESQPYPVQAYPVQECTTRYETRVEEQTRGYQVAYVFEGREYFTETRTPPGDRIPIEISVRPAF